MGNVNNTRKIELQIDLEGIKNREEFMKFIDKILKYDFVKFYDADSIYKYLKREFALE